MMVISKTTKGKNARIELAATEKAKVWTSVLIKYFTVERTRLWRGRATGRIVRWRAVSADGRVGIGGVVTGRSMVAEPGDGPEKRRNRSFEGRLSSDSFIFVKAIPLCPQ